MTQYRTPQLLTPPREEEEKYPYRRVWISIIIEMAGLFGVTIGLYIAIGFVGISFPESFWQFINLCIALLPAGLWLIISRLRESFALDPRLKLTPVFVITALSANAVALPLLNALAIEQWLSLAGTFERILGYAVTVGIIQEIVKYTVIRFTAWPDGFRMRYDPLAYCLTAAIGYVTVVNLQFAFAGTPSPDVFAARVWSNTTLHVVGSAIVAFGFAELRFNPRLFIAMPISVVVAALVVGFGITFRAGLTNGGFVLGIGGTRPIFGIVFSFLIVTAALFSISLLFNNAERRAQQRDEGTEEHSTWA